MFGKFWGNHVNGKLIELIRLIHDYDQDIMIKTLPLQENGKYGSPQLLLTSKPSDECLEKIREMYRINLFQNDDNTEDYKYLMTIEPLRFAYEREWHYPGKHDSDKLPRSITHNKWDFDGYFYITDALDSYRRIAIIPYKSNTDFDSGHNLHKSEALALVKNIVRLLNNGELL